MINLSQKDQLRAYVDQHQEVNTKAQANQIIADLTAQAKDWEVAKDWRDYFYHEYFLLLSTAYVVKEDYQNALKLLTEGLKDFEQAYKKYGYAVKAETYHRIGVCYCHLKEKDKAYEAFRNAVYYSLFNMNHRHYTHYEHYCFRSSDDYAIADLRDGKISLSSIFAFNDPVDSAYFPWMEWQMKTADNDANKMFIDLMYKAYGEFRARCFIGDMPLPDEYGTPRRKYDILPVYENTIMWAHYADYHKGYCAKYVFPMEFTSQPEDNGIAIMMAPINYVEYMPFKDSMTFQEGFLTKSIRWSYEHENRIIYYQKDGATKDHPEVKHPKGCLKEVYIGLRCDDNKVKAILDAVRDKPEVTVYKMKISERDIYSIEPELIRKGVGLLADENKDTCFCHRVCKCVKETYNKVKSFVNKHIGL
jgi:Protein of unknown function (DUF2971).